MDESFKGTLYLNGSKNKQVVLITFEFDSLKFNSESEKTYEVPYSKLNIELGGYENRLIIIKAVSNNDSLLCYIDEDSSDNFLKALSRLNLYISSANIDRINSDYRNSKIKRLLIEWAEWIIAIIVLLLSLVFYIVFNLIRS